MLIPMDNKVIQAVQTILLVVAQNGLLFLYDADVGKLLSSLFLVVFVVALLQKGLFSPNKILALMSRFSPCN